MFTEAQLKAGVGMALRNRDAALNDAVTLQIDLVAQQERNEMLLGLLRQISESDAVLPAELRKQLDSLFGKEA
jgi:hypothetical protein